MRGRGWAGMMAVAAAALMLAGPALAQDAAERDWSADAITQAELDELLALLDTLSATVAAQQAELETRPEEPAAPIRMTDGPFADLSTAELEALLQGATRDRFRKDGAAIKERPTAPLIAVATPPTVVARPVPKAAVPAPGRTVPLPTRRYADLAARSSLHALVEVQRGETLYAVSRLACLHPRLVLDANPLPDQNTVEIGDIVRVPPGHCLPPERIVGTAPVSLP